MLFNDEFSVVVDNCIAWSAIFFATLVEIRSKIGSSEKTDSCPWLSDSLGFLIERLRAGRTMYRKFQETIHESD